MAVAEVFFSAGSRFEQYFNPVDIGGFDIELDVEVEERKKNTLLFSSTKKKDEDEGLNA